MTTPSSPLEITAPVSVWAAALDTFAGMRGGSSLPILDCLLIQYQPGDGAPTFTRNDHERQIRLRLPLDQITASGQGEIAIDARKVAAIIKACPQTAELRLRQSEGRVTLAASINGQRPSRFTLGYLPGEDFPLMTTTPGADDEAPPPLTRITVTGRRLAAALGRVSCAMARNDVRYYLNGIHCEWRGNSLLLVATDGHILGHMALQTQVEGGDGQAILPRDTVGLVERMASDAGGDELILEFIPTRLRVALRDRELISKLIDGRFPDWRRVIPSSHVASWTMRVDDLTQALQRVRILSNDQFRGARFEITQDAPDVLMICASNAEHDYAGDAVSLTEPSDAPMVIGFNIDYVLSVLAACPTATVTWHITGGGGGARLVPGTPTADEGQDDPEWVIMPMLL